MADGLGLMVNAEVPKPVIDLGNSSHEHKIYTMRHWENKRNPAPLAKGIHVLRVTVACICPGFC